MRWEIGAGWLVDRLLGEPPARWHPVAAFGNTMERLEASTYRPSRAAGVLHAALGVGGAFGAGLVLQRLLGRRTATTVALAVSVAGRMLGTEAAATLDLVERGDLDAARRRVRALVGRDADGLDASGLVRATIESQAENTVDAVVAPLCWAAVGGAPAVLGHRAVNTLDAMIGHRNARYARFGWAAARADDVVNYVPARVVALAVAALRPRRARQIAAAVRRDAPAHPSPNGGVIEAAVAAALDIRLGGTNSYRGAVEERGQLGSGTEPTVTDGRSAISLTTAAGALIAVTLTTFAGRGRLGVKA